MPAVTLVDRPVEMKVYLPTSVRAELDLQLYSTVEGRVPKGSYTNLITHLVKEHLRKLREAKSAEARKLAKIAAGELLAELQIGQEHEAQ